MDVRRARAGGDCASIDDMECFGALVNYWEAPERRATRSKTDVPGRRGIWVGRSTVISGGHRDPVVPIDYNKGQWTLGPTIHRSYVKPMNQGSNYHYGNAVIIHWQYES